MRQLKRICVINKKVVLIIYPILGCTFYGKQLQVYIYGGLRPWGLRWLFSTILCGESSMIRKIPHHTVLENWSKMSHWNSLTLAFCTIFFFKLKLTCQGVNAARFAAIWNETFSVIYKQHASDSSWLLIFHQKSCPAFVMHYTNFCCMSGTRFTSHLSTEVGELLLSL